jgi:ABC-type nitrate/sulfonate/bicarbonate transport system ATPase subunit
MSDKPFRLERVSHSFGAVEVLREVSLEIVRGEFVAVVGPSGCGKTTLLNILSGYEPPTSGNIEREGHERMVYQRDGLFPWQTVTENISLGLRHVADERERRLQLTELLGLIGLEGFEQHYPHQLSGGMRQRVELARALAGDSETLLMDEPFSSLDYLTRIRMRQELARILLERSRTVVLVTHDIEEAAQLADRVIVLTERPAKIHYELTISAPRPRGLTHPEVVQAIDRLLTELGIQTKSEELKP